MDSNNRVIAGPAGHWYALWIDGDEETLIGLPMSAGEDRNEPPSHPAGDALDPFAETGWYEITDPAPETDDAALVAELKATPAQLAAIASTERAINDNDNEATHVRTAFGWSGYDGDGLAVRFIYRHDDGREGLEVTVFDVEGEVVESQDFG